MSGNGTGGTSGGGVVKKNGINTIIKDGLIDEIILYENKSPLMRLDVFPFVILYFLSTLMILSVDLFPSSSSEGLHDGEKLANLKLAGLILFPIVLVGHLLVFLYAQSSLTVRCFLGKRRIDDIHDETHQHSDRTIYVHVVTNKTIGNDRIVKLERNQPLINASAAALAASSSSSSSSVPPKKSIGNMEKKMLDQHYALNAFTFTFQEVTYYYHVGRNTFCRMDYPTNISVKTCLSWEGHSNSGSVMFAFQRWGLNDFNIPIPHFLDLYMEHLVAPFFVFQVLCLFLWSLDDYWYYSVFTLMMLMLFEGVMCNQRQNNVLMMRNMRRPPYLICVYRNKEWVETRSDGIVPGDIISITSDKPVFPDENGRPRKDKKGDNGFDGKVLPCDILLIRGNCVVNEAMLTGESVPKVKESIIENQDQLLAGSSHGNHVDITKHPNWSRHFLLGGTMLQQHSNTGTDLTASSRTSSSSSSGSSMAVIPNAPDGGCIGIVIRTGFATTQGELMRKILFATESTGTAGNSSETFSFIAVLVLFAIVAATVVLYEGLMDETRNKFRLVLHCIMIITSVVPPELPMELSLAVTTSLAALSKQMIFCTEPFRIAYAGRLNVVCFDKTGTLTKDEMMLKGVVAAQDVNIFTGQSLDVMDIPSLLEADAAAATFSSSVTGGSSAVPILHHEMISPDFTTTIVRCIMGCCHDLVQRISYHHQGQGQDQPNILGDPLEFVSFAASGFKFLISSSSSSSSSQGIATNHMVNTDHQIAAHVLHKYPFSSDLKRMSVMVQLSSVSTSPSSSSSAMGAASNTATGSSSSSGGMNGIGSRSKDFETVTYIFCKGAPEILQPLFKTVPEHYTRTYQYHMQAGKRVLALAYKLLPTNNTVKVSREQAEKDLLFAGFLIFDCDLKADSKSVIKELKSSSHRVVMITGDSVYTAANVSKRLSIFDSGSSPQRTALVLHPILVENASSSSATSSNTSSKHQLVWRPLDSAIDDHESHKKQEGDIDYQLEQVGALTNRHVLCVTGAALDTLPQSSSTLLGIMKKLCPHVTIFARVSPLQKEKILLALNDSGLYTLMCGDGTNDVGALKAAHVGVSIINNPKLESIVEEAATKSNAANAAATGAGSSSSGAAGGKSGKKGTKAKGGNAKDRMARAMLELQAHESDPSIVKLGDASIASPFTAKRTSIDSVLTVIRQGRCTLVTTIQVYKVLALNCLACAFMMSALYMRGLKQGDTQMTCSGLVLAALFFFLSQAKPIGSISDCRPPSSVFSSAVSYSIIGQFAVHLSCMFLTMRLCELHTNAEDFSLSPDGKFSPNLINSAMFILSTQMLVNNFWVNYRGPPYMEELSSNIYFWRLLQAVYVVIFIVVGGQFEPINDLLQLVQFPNQDFQVKFLGILAMNAGVTYFIERSCRKLE